MMDYMELIELAFSDKSFKAMALVISLRGLSQIKGIRLALDKLTTAYKAHEKRDDERFENVDGRLKKLEPKEAK